jgi:hypothetical protein
MNNLFLIPAVDKEIQIFNLEPIDTEKPGHMNIYNSISQNPNLFTTENISEAFKFRGLFNFNFNFYNDILIYLKNHLEHFNIDIQVFYMEYVCIHVLGSVSQHARVKTPTIENFQHYGEVANMVLENLKGKIDESKWAELNCVPTITDMDVPFPGGKSKKRRSNKRKSKKNLKK